MVKELIFYIIFFSLGISQNKVVNYFRRLSIYAPELMKDSFFRMHPGNARRVTEIEEKIKALQSEQ